MTLSLGTRVPFTMVLLNAATVNKDGETSVSFALPAGLGDCYVLDLAVWVANTATLATLDGSQGALGRIVDANGLGIDFIGVGPIRSIGATHAAFQITPDAPVLWKEGESLNLKCMELDTNASPTGDWLIYVRVQPTREPTARPARFRLTS